MAINKMLKIMEKKFKSEQSHFENQNVFYSIYIHKKNSNIKHCK